MLVGIHFDNAKLVQYAMKIRTPKLIVMLITAFAIGGASKEVHVLLLLVRCEPQRFAVLLALFQGLLGLPQLSAGRFQLGVGGGIFPDSLEDISQAHRQAPFLNREISRSSTRMRHRTLPAESSRPFIWL